MHAKSRMSEKHCQFVDETIIANWYRIGCQKIPKEMWRDGEMETKNGLVLVACHGVRRQDNVILLYGVPAHAWPDRSSISITDSESLHSNIPSLHIESSRTHGTKR
jgi:hypothetical protein